MTGSSTPVDLSSPIPLAPATQIHQGDPLFIRVTDKDQNLDRTLVETVLVTVTDPANGDVEVLKLTGVTGYRHLRWVLSHDRLRRRQLQRAA